MQGPKDYPKVSRITRQRARREAERAKWRAYNRKLEESRAAREEDMLEGAMPVAEAAEEERAERARKVEQIELNLDAYSRAESGFVGDPFEGIGADAEETGRVYRKSEWRSL